MTIAVDFDGTIVEHCYPAIGKERPFAIETLLMLQKEGHRIILWTVREGVLLYEAVEWCRVRGLEFYAINKDYPEEVCDSTINHNFSRKIKADMFIDDRNIGGHLDWGQIYHMIKDNKNFNDILAETRMQALQRGTAPQKKHWWQFLI